MDAAFDAAFAAVAVAATSRSAPLIPKKRRAFGVFVVTQPITRYLMVRPDITIVRMVALDMPLSMPKAITGCRMIGSDETRSIPPIPYVCIKPVALAHAGEAKRSGKVSFK